MKPFLLSFILIFIMKDYFYTHAIIFNLTVSPDGSGDFRKINDAIASTPKFLKSRFYIRVKPGIYYEYVEILEEMTNIALIGDNPKSTIIVGNRSNKTGYHTSKSATLTVRGFKFMAQSLTIKNSAGPEAAQAVALYDSADKTTYFECIFDGFQDTLYAKGKVKFFKMCQIFGSVDFICGDALAMFQDCEIFIQSGRYLTITAQSKERVTESSGFSFQRCSVKYAPGIKDKGVTAFLGRPWRKFSTVIFMQCFLDTVIDPKGWTGWPKVPLNYLFYAEYNNSGPGANTFKRVKWPGYHVIWDEKDAVKFTVQNFIDGNSWLPETGVPFTPGLH